MSWLRAASRTKLLPAAFALSLGLTASADGAEQTGEQLAPTVEHVVVTGSRIPGANLPTASPLSQMSDKEIRSTAAIRIEDIINQMPQAFADQNSSITNSATGTATVNLRDLGPERTLVLIDGKRLMPGDPSGQHISSDLNFIPVSLVERVDVMTGGSSAVYGSDAIAGVVNFILKRNFTGFALDMKGTVNTHENSQSTIQASIAAARLDPVPSSVTDGWSGDFTATAGFDLPDGEGNLSVYAGYRRASAVTQATRDFSACALFASGLSQFCQGSPRSVALGRFEVLDPATGERVSSLTLDPDKPGSILRPFDRTRDGYNTAPYQYYQRPDERYTAGVLAHYQISPAAEIYLDAMFMRDNTTGQLAPSGLFQFPPLQVSCANPMLSADEVQKFCTDVGVPSGGNALLLVGRRNQLAGGRQSLLAHTDYRAVGGLRGDFDGWRYDVSAQYASVAIKQVDLHDVSLSRAREAIDVTRDPSGNIVCASGNPKCVPYDVFSIDGITSTALDYLDVRATATGGTEETVISANLSSDLGRHGLKSPWATESASVALGTEYRRESLSYEPGAELTNGDLASASAPTPAVSGSFDVKELYGELRLPIVQEQGILLHALEVDAGYRVSWYGDAGASHTYKLGVIWEPEAAVQLRASYNHAVRAPNAVELFTPQHLDGAVLDTDPCAGPDPASVNRLATPANCARTGVTAEQYGHIVVSPDMYNALTGGNTELKPEAADTLTVGIVLTPALADGLNLAVDYFRIHVDGVIGTSLTPDVALSQCLSKGEALYCNLVHRAPVTGSLWLTPDGYVDARSRNAAMFETQGVDLNLSYSQELPPWGTQALGMMTIRLAATYLMKLDAQPAVDSPTYDCAGLYGQSCGDPVPRWRHLLRTSWETPFDFEISVAWRYIAAVTNAAATSNPILTGVYEVANRRLGARSYIDASFDWPVTEQLEIRAGVSNMFDTDPPIATGSTQTGVVANGNTYPGVYDVLGRTIFAAITVR